MASCVPGGRTQEAQGWAGPASQDGILYVCSIDGKVIGVDLSIRDQGLYFPAEGEWSYAITTTSQGFSCAPSSVPVSIFATPVVDGDSVYVGTYHGKIFALNTQVRSQNMPFPQVRSNEWLYPRTNEVIGGIVSSPAIDENAMYVTSSDGRVYSLGKEFGDLNWESDVLSEKLWTSPVVEGDTIYVSAFEGYIYTLSTSDGSLLPWTFKADAGLVSSPVLYEDMILVGSFDRNLYAIKIGGDAPAWKLSGGSWFWAAPIVDEGIAYASCLDGKIYAINAGTGELLWEFDAGSPIVSSPILAGDFLVVAAESGDIHVFDISVKTDAKIRMPIKTISIEGTIRAPLFVQEDIVYVYAQNNHLYALDVNSGRINWKLSLDIKEE